MQQRLLSLLLYKVRNTVTDFIPSLTLLHSIAEQNSPPVAHAGGDQTVTLPTNSIYMDGTKSTDDLGIVKYEWTRDSTSLAIGTIVGNTDHEPVLIVSDFTC